MMWMGKRGRESAGWVDVEKRIGRGGVEKYKAYVRRQGCLVPRRLPVGRSLGVVECQGAVQACHVVSRGAGGANIGNLVPLCGAHHNQQHTVGIESFQRWYSIDLPLEAAKIEKDYWQGGQDFLNLADEPARAATKPLIWGSNPNATDDRGAGESQGGGQEDVRDQADRGALRRHREIGASQVRTEEVQRRTVRGRLHSARRAG